MYIPKYLITFSESYGEENTRETENIGTDFGLQDTEDTIARTIIKEQKGTKIEKRRGTWDDKQKSIVKNYFSKHIRDRKTPKKQECLHFQNENSDLFKEKSWIQIKVFVYNMFKNKH